MEMELVLVMCEMLFDGDLKAMAADVQARIDGKAHTFRFDADPAEMLAAIKELALAVR